MILLPYSRPWTQQPQEGAAVNWGHPLARGLAAASIAGGTPGDITPYTNANGYSLEAGAQGLYGRLTSASTQYWYSTDAARIVTTHPLTALAIVRPATVHAGAVLTVYNSTSQYHELMVGSTGQLQLWSTAVGASSASAASAYVAGEEFVVAGRVSSDTSRDVWKNGILLASSTMSRAPTAATANRWGLFNDTTERFNGGMALRLLWGRALSDAEMGSIGVDPWQLFEPQRIWVPVSAGGGTNASVTLTGCSAASAAGTTVALGSATAALSGASSAASAGTVTASAGSSATVTLSGASSASAAGSLLATAGATAVLSGTSSASAAGAVAAVGGAALTLTGASASTAAGILSGLGGASITLTGAEASGAAGSVTATAGGSTAVTLVGASASTAAGSITASGGASIVLSGVSASSAAGSVSATAGGSTSVTLIGASTSAAAGILAGFGGAQITLTGASASGAAGSASASAGSGSGTGATAAEIWSYTLSNGLTAEQTLVAIHTMLSELHLIHGLTAGSPLSVTAASRAAGAVSQAVAEAAGTVTVTRQ